MKTLIDLIIDFGNASYEAGAHEKEESFVGKADLAKECFQEIVRLIGNTGMSYAKAKAFCHVRSAIYRLSVGERYWKNHHLSLDEQVSEADKLATDWAEYDPREYGVGPKFKWEDGDENNI